MTIFAVTNQKGGVGKTTVTANIGGAVNSLGFRPLLIDADPQGYLTSAVGFNDAYTAEGDSLHDALLNPGGYDIRDLVHKHNEFDFIPANIDMFTLEQELVSAMQSRRRLTRLLEGINDWDLVLIDCPPSLGILTDNALLAAQNVLIPAEAEDTSIRALDLLFKQIDSLEDSFGETIQERALVVSNVDYPLDGEQQGMLGWFDENFGGYLPIYQVRNRAAIKRAWNSGVSVFHSDEECDQRDELQRIGQQLIDISEGER
jgi:chromosome partitioning protein